MRRPVSLNTRSLLLGAPLLLCLAGCLERTTGESKPLPDEFLDQIADDKEDARIAGEGPTIKVSGEAMGEDGIPIDIDIVVVDPAAPGGQNRLGKIVTDGPGPFELTLPANAGTVILAFFQDMDGDGPDEDDTFQKIEVVSAAEDVSGLSVQLELGAYENIGHSTAGLGAPGGGGPEGAAPPPGGGGPGGAPAAQLPVAAQDLEKLPIGTQPFADHDGPLVTVRGEIKSQRKAPVDVDVVVLPDGGLAGKLRLDGPGPYELLVPRDAGSVRLHAFQDIAEDGPGALDPATVVEIEVGELDVDGVELALELIGLAEAAAEPDAAAHPHEEKVHVEVAPGGGGGGPEGGVVASEVGPFDDYEGDTVTIRGVIQSDADIAVDLDLRVPAADAPGGVKDVGKLLLGGPGEFSVVVPAGYGALTLEGFQDPGNDGPDSSDPWGSQVVDVRDQDVEGLVLVLRPGARGTGAQHTEVPHAEAAAGANQQVDFAALARPLTAGGVGPFANHRGGFVKVRGTVRSESELPVDLDVWIEDAAAPGGLRNQGKVVLLRPGSFVIDVPENAGRMAIEGYQDEAVDGPTETDAFARVDLDVGGKDIDELVLSLKQTGSRGGGGGAAAPPAEAKAPFEGVTGPTVTVSGVVRAKQDGVIDIDIRVPDADAPGGMRQEGKIRLDGPGVFELTVPADLGALELEAFQDGDQNGPDDDDPYARLDIEVGQRSLQAALDLVEGGRAVAASAGAPSHDAGALGGGDAFPAWKGDRVTISGTVVYSGEGLVDIDLFKTDASSPGGRTIAGKLKVKAGEFSFTAPKDFGSMELEAFVDIDGDGPSASDPVGRYTDNPLTVGGDDISGVQVVIEGG